MAMMMVMKLTDVVNSATHDEDRKFYYLKVLSRRIPCAPTYSHPSSMAVMLCAAMRSENNAMRTS